MKKAFKFKKKNRKLKCKFRTVEIDGVNLMKEKRSS